MNLNPQETATFLQCLGGENFVFQTFDDSDQKRKTLSRVLIGTFDQHAKELIQLNIQGAGVFVQVNRGNKRGKAHIKGINVLFIDLDNIETAKESLRCVQKYMPKPTAVINSSKNKFHIYWKVLDCKLEEFKKMQLSLAVRFNSDLAMINLDRVMRLPGFAHKKYEPVISKILMTSETVQTVAQLYRAAEKAPTLAPSNHGTVTNGVQSDQLKKDAFGLDIGSDYELPASTPREGRNHALIKYVGHLLGKGMRDEQKMQDKVREMNTKFDDPLPENELEATIFQSLAKYAEERKVEDESKAQIAMANNKAATPVPTPPKEVGSVPAPPDITKSAKPIDEQFLERYVFSTEGQKVIDTHARGEHKVIAWADFKAAMSNVGKHVANNWKENPMRKSCRDIMWYPGDKDFIWVDAFPFYNVYRKPDVVPVDKKDFDLSKLEIFFEHLEYLFPNNEDRKFFLNWFAKTVIAPTVRIPWAPLLISEEGAGKNVIFEVLAELLGTDNAETVLMDALESQFNPYMMRSALVLIDEVSKPKKEAIVDKMKAYITNSTLYINAKGAGERKFPIYTNVILFSNNDTAAEIKDGDRRFWVHKIKGVKPSEYYDRIFGWFKHETKTTKTIYTDNLAHLLRWCMERDLSKFNHNHRPPETASKRAMIFENRSGLDVEITDAIENREGPFAADIVPTKTIKQFISVKIGRDLTIQEERLVPKILNQYSAGDFFSNALKSIDKNIVERGRARCIRNMKHWAAAGTDKQNHEFTRSLQIYLKVQEVFPPTLEIVTGDTNAKSSKS